MPISDHLINEVRLAVLKQTIDSGEVPRAEELAPIMGLGEAQVVDAFRALADRHVYVLQPGDPTRLRMANPFSAIPTSFSVFASGHSYFGNCVWDALGIVSLLGGEGRVETVCPDCREPMALEVSGRQLVHGHGVVHFSVPARHWWDDIVFT